MRYSIQVRNSNELYDILNTGMLNMSYISSAPEGYGYPSDIEIDNSQMVSWGRVSGTPRYSTPEWLNPLNHYRIESGG